MNLAYKSFTCYNWARNKNLARFIYVALYLSFFGQIQNIRNFFFYNSYSDSIKFSFFLYNLFTKLRNKPNSSIQEYFELLKLDISFREIDWDDKKFDLFIYYLVTNMFKLNERRLSPVTTVSHFLWFHSSFFFISNKFNNLSFAENKRFGFNSQIFNTWSNYSTGGVSPYNIFLHKGILGSFQNQFNYSDSVALASMGSVFNYIHTLRPIYPDMEDLPFAIVSLRPYFDHLPTFHYFNSLKRLHYVSIYYMDVGMFSKILFDRYLYTHAKLLLDVPYTFTHIIDSRYLINFGSLYYSRQFFYYFGYLSDNWFFSRKRFDLFVLLPFSSGIEVGYCFNTPRVYARLVSRKKIKQILLDSWIGVSRIRPYFDNMMIPFNRGYYSELDSDYTGSTSYDYAGTFVGITTNVAFNRVTSRIFQEFSKFLYLSSPVEISFIIELIENGLLWLNQLLSGWTSEFLSYSNTLIEYEYGYKGLKASSPAGVGVFENLFIEFVNYFFDYELWLFVFFGSLFDRLDAPFYY